ncbi:DUF11 domain-containing protein [Halomonas denitrificans]|nr:DUF11 domain-containing protein [Halomonas denitrificans]
MPYLPSRRPFSGPRSHVRPRGRTPGFLVSLLAAALLLPGLVHAQNRCATPGADGNLSLAGVVNTYYTPSAGSYGPASTSIPLSSPRGAAAPIAAGDLVLVIQMQCANINSSDSLLYGNGAAGEPASGFTDPASGCIAGRHEFVRAGPGSSASLLNLSATPLTLSYQQAAATPTQGRRTFQVVRVPQALNAILTGNVTALEWDGFSGGIVAIDAAFGFDFNGFAVRADGAGFRGGAGDVRATNDAVQRFRWDDPTRHGSKGEGIAGTPRLLSTKRTATDGATAAIIDLGAGWGGYPTGTATSGNNARGAPGNAGGGGAFWNGSSDNGGGGGGGNAGAGGRGAAGWRSAGYAGILPDYSNMTDKKWGFGGASVPASISRLVLGGGGGAGDNNNNSTAVQSSAAAGGGIVMIRAGTLSGTGVVSARGGRATDNPLNDGAGGGGAGGSIAVIASTWSATLDVRADGGRGGDAWATGASAHGSGGGGGGGFVVTSAAPASVNVAGGPPGVTTTADSPPGGPTHGARPGAAGMAVVIAPGTDGPGGNAGRACRADLAIDKSNPTSPFISGQTTTYTIVVTNNGPQAAGGAVVTDTPSAGLVLNSVSCSASGGAVCPAGPITVGDLTGPGVVIPTFPVGSSVTFTVQATVTASGT